MTKLKLAICSLCGILSVACIDREYDLSLVKEGNVAIGNETSEFRMPLVTVRIPMSSLGTDDGDIRSILSEADIWLPSSEKSVDMVRLKEDPSYPEQLIAQTIREMRSSASKLNAVIGLTYDSYYEVFAPTIGLGQSRPSPSEYTVAFAYAFQSELTAREIENSIGNVASEYLASIRIADIDFPVDRIGLDDSVIEMLCGNLDPEEAENPKRTLHLYGTISNRLPLKMHIAPMFLPSDISFELDVEAASDKSPIPPTRLFERDLRQLVEGISIRVPLTLQTYYRDLPFDDNADQIAINLYLLKRGEISLDL